MALNDTAQDDLVRVVVLEENSNADNIVTQEESNNGTTRSTDPHNNDMHLRDNDHTSTADPHAALTAAETGVVGTARGTAVDLEQSSSSLSSVMEPSSGSSQTSGSMTNNNNNINVMNNTLPQQQQEPNSVSTMNDIGTTPVQTSTVSMQNTTTSTRTANAADISAIDAQTTTNTANANSHISTTAAPPHKRTKRTYRKRTLTHVSATSTNRSNQDSSSSNIMAWTAETLPADQTDIRTLIQTFDEQQFLVWGYEMEIERQRRTALRLQQQESSTTSSGQQQQLGTAGNASNQVQQGSTQHNNAMMMNSTNPSTAATDHQNHLQHPNNNLIRTADPTNKSNGQLHPTNVVDLQQDTMVNATVAAATSDHGQHQHGASASGTGAPSRSSTTNTIPPLLPPPQKLTKQELTWNQRFQELVDYKIKHGHCNVPDVGSGKLSTWVSVQRTAWKHRFWKGEKSSMTDERHMKLQNLGFRFEIKNQWETRFQQLLEFKSHNGHTRVPQHYKQLGNLGMWVKGQRAAYRHLKSGAAVKTSNHHKLDPGRIQKLNDIGFEWVVKSRRSGAGSGNGAGSGGAATNAKDALNSTRTEN